MESEAPSFSDLDLLFLHKSPMCPAEFDPDEGVSGGLPLAQGDAL